MIDVGPIGGAKMSDEHVHELILNLLVQRVNRFSLVALGSKRVHECSRQVLVDEHLHAAACASASSAKTPRTASTVRLG